MTNLQWDDDRALTELAAALAPPDVPAGVLEAARAVYTWRTVDAELAALAYDSATARQVPLGVRGDQATLRSLTFEAANIVIEVEVGADAIVGQIVPPLSGTVDVHAPTGVVGSVEVDDVGSFSVRSIPRGPFQLAYRTPGGDRVVTSWVTL